MMVLPLLSRSAHNFCHLQQLSDAVAAASDGGRHDIIRRRRLLTVAGCAIHDGDGDDMLWMQLVKVGNVFDRAKAPA